MHGADANEDVRPSSICWLLLASGSAMEFVLDRADVFGEYAKLCTVKVFKF